MPEEMKKRRGKRNNHKMKPYLIYEYLMRNTDGTHKLNTEAILQYLEDIGIYAERRSIYKDIEEINRAILLTTRDAYGLHKADTLEEADKLLKNENEKTILYDKNAKGFYVRKRHYSLEDIRALAECVYASKFLDEKRAKRLVNVVCDLVSENDAEGLRRDVIQLDRGKSNSVANYETLKKISLAISRKRIKNTTHIPEKIKFKYLSFTLQGGLKRTERRSGEWYMVSPYQLLISDGNYYLMGYDDKMRKMVNYRVDRMKDLELTGEPRSGAEEYNELSMDTYLQEHFGMYQGDRDHIQIRALNMLLDTFVDRFGTRDVLYSKDDDKHFTATVKVAVSNQFFGWLCGFGKKVKILSPSPVVEEFKQYLDKMRGLYE